MQASTFATKSGVTRAPHSQKQAPTTACHSDANPADSHARVQDNLLRPFRSRRVGFADACPLQRMSSDDCTRSMCFAIDVAASCWCSLVMRLSIEAVVIAPKTAPLALRIANPIPMTPGTL
jgi:hypothetical protein